MVSPLPLVYLLIVAALVSSSCSTSEQLSTVFVLETSDSSDSSPIVSHDREPSSGPRKKSVDPNTHIITDDTPPSSSPATPSTTNTALGNKPQKLQVEPQQSNPSYHGNPTQSSTVIKVQRDSNASINSNNDSNNGGSQNWDNNGQRENQRDNQRDNNHNSSGSSRRIEEESPIVAPNRQKVSAIVRGSTSTQRPSYVTSNSTPRARSTTSAYERDSEAQSSKQQAKVPPTEERLLISITSGDDEDDNGNYRPPQKQVISSGGTISIGAGPNDGELQVQQSQSPPKRKPSITISIQDASTNKQFGGPSAVIVRPSDNGQHAIVISTVGAGHQLDDSNFKQNNSNKPPIIISSNNNNDQPYKEPPYREPVETNNNNNGHEHQQQVTHHQHVMTSTHRPPPAPQQQQNEYNPQPSRPINTPNDYNNQHNSRPINNQQQDYNPSGPANRPIVSTLVDQPRPPVQVVDEPPRPSKQVMVVTEEPIYEPPPPPHQRPSPRPVVIKPVNVPPPEMQSSNNNNNNNYNNNNENEDSTKPSTIPPQVQQQQMMEPKFPLNEKSCGLVHETRIVGGEEADAAENRWMAAIIKSKPSTGDVRPFCGGSLITRRHILTAAHCLEGLAPRDVLVRLGSYDFDDSTASSLSSDYAIDQFRVPAQYGRKTHIADIAIMRLKTPLSTTDDYRTVCMPQPRRSYVGALGTVTGYGSQSQTFRRAAPKLRQVTVPIWENRKCSSVYKKNLTESFLCAGYEEGGKDACQGDSGGPLAVEGPNERMMIVGVVSHGIGCGSPGYPGVYTRVGSFIEWIEKNTKE